MNTVEDEKRLGRREFLSDAKDLFRVGIGATALGGAGYLFLQVGDAWREDNRIIRAKYESGERDEDWLDKQRHGSLVAVGVSFFGAAPLMALGVESIFNAVMRIIERRRNLL